MVSCDFPVYKDTSHPDILNQFNSKAFCQLIGFRSPRIVESRIGFGNNQPQIKCVAKDICLIDMSLNIEKRVYQLEKQLVNKEAELAYLCEQLAAAQKHAVELSDISQSSEKQLLDVTASHNKYRQESEFK